MKGPQHRAMGSWKLKASKGSAITPPPQSLASEHDMWELPKKRPSACVYMYVYIYIYTRRFIYVRIYIYTSISILAFSMFISVSISLSASIWQFYTLGVLFKRV